MRNSKDKDFASPAAAANYLQELVNSGRLALTADGGGIPEPQSILFESMRVIGVWELERIILLLEKSA